VGTYLGTQGEVVKVRIKKKPDEREMDGVNLDRLAPGTVRDVSPSIGSWLVAEGYAEPEMRRTDRIDDHPFTSLPDRKRF
jgi:hypothetical protein